MSQITRFELRGICCANGIVKARKAMASIRGVSKVTVDLANNLAVVTGVVDPDAIVSALRNAGFEAAYLSTESA